MARVVRDVVKGAIAGAIGVWVMDRLTWYMYRSEDPEAYRQEKEAQVEGKYAAHATASKLAKAAGTQLEGKPLYAAGKTIHYILGIAPGALYGANRHRINGLSTWKGLVYGAGLFLLVDEIIAPLLGITSGPLAYPWQAHARGLAGHLALGATTDAGVRALDKVM